MAAKISTKADNSLVTEMASWNQSRSVSGSESKSRRGRKRIAISVDDGLSDQISLATSDDSRNTSEISSVSDNPLEIFFAAVVLQKTESGKDITPTFTFLPSRRAYPQYYEIIKEPLDLRMLAQKIKNGSYSTIDDLEHDFNVMIKNAKTFNEPKSEVYQDSLELQKIIKNKRISHDQGGKPQKKRGRQNRNPASITDKFAQMISRQGNVDETEEQVNELEQIVDPDNDLDISAADTSRQLQWQLYKTVTSTNFNNGPNPTTPFMKFPSKKLYPHYYLEILEPMSLLMVKAKIKNYSYRDVDETLRDLNLVFNNAQQFNVEDSGIYKDAVRLQNLARMKRAEIMNASL